MDCFVAEPVIGLAEGETRWLLAMTARLTPRSNTVPHYAAANTAVIAAWACC